MTPRVGGNTAAIYTKATIKGAFQLDYRSEITRMTSRVPQKVREGSMQQAVAWKKLQEKAVMVARKFRASELELSETYSQLKQYE